MSTLSIAIYFREQVLLDTFALSFMNRLSLFETNRVKECPLCSTEAKILILWSFAKILAND